MDISYYLESGLLERYALDQLGKYQTDRINQLLKTSLELGEALENIHIKLERSKMIQFLED